MLLIIPLHQVLALRAEVEIHRDSACVTACDCPMFGLGIVQ